ncbi:MAG: putative toxin-antitoxin system toxin component, PIN family [Acidobacteria bacterium 13_1_20CM_3_53_8]|nr:MAG: putative toxin-antitoxin system toxin component, PIN family [Acidobacteria bacterium 13_1_20CM_3_53_8]
MKVVIDTSVVVSAALKDRDPEAIILFVVERPEFEWIVSASILEEYKAVLRRERFGLPKEILHKWDEMFDGLTTNIAVDVEVDFPRDRKDARFLECALVADAEYLITGDKDFTEAQKLINTTIISVTMFKKIVMDAWS